jgi:NAD+ synthase
MRNYEVETQKRVKFIGDLVKAAGASGLVYGNSGGKDSALVGIICKKACDNTLGLIMPCGSNQNYTTDKDDAQVVAKQFNIETRIVDLSDVKKQFIQAVDNSTKLNAPACANIAPRLRMSALYAVAAAENRIVAGTGNRSEIYMGYFTKWGDGACDFNPIADLCVSEIYEFLRFLKAPASIIEKAPSAGLFDGQTDEKEMGITYRSIDDFLLNGVAEEKDKSVIKKFHDKSGHKRILPILFES